MITKSLSPDWRQLMHIAVRDVDPEDDQTLILEEESVEGAYAVMT